MPSGFLARNVLRLVFFKYIKMADFLVTMSKSRRNFVLYKDRIFFTSPFSVMIFVLNFFILAS